MPKHIYYSNSNSPEDVRLVSHNRKRNFRNLMRDINSALLPSAEIGEKPLEVGFVLLEHFSMMAFTAAVNVLQTSNFVFSAPLFHFTTYGIDSSQVMSDQGIKISTQGNLDSLQECSMDVLIICGGLGCSMSENKKLTQILKVRANNKTILGGIWNGAVSLAYTGLLDDTQCALHPDSHAFMNKQFDRVTVSEHTHVEADKLITCAGHVSAPQMMLKLIEQLKGKDTLRAICEILSCDSIAEGGEPNLIQDSDSHFSWAF